MVLHEHVERVLGVDLTGPAEAHASNPAYVGPALELLSHGLVMPHWFDAIATNAGSDADVAPPGTAGAEEEA
jgi:hypothetical protein